MSTKLLIKRIRQIALTLILLIASFYLSSPWWMGSLLQLWLPESITITRASFHLVTPKGIEVHDIILELPQGRLSIDRLESDLSVKNMNIQKLSIVLHSADTDGDLSMMKPSQTSLRLPELATSFTEMLTLMPCFKIDTLEFFTTLRQFVFADVNSCDVELVSKNTTPQTLSQQKPSETLARVQLQADWFIDNLLTSQGQQINQNAITSLALIVELSRCAEGVEISALVEGHPFIQLRYSYGSNPTVALKIDLSNAFLDTLLIRIGKTPWPVPVEPDELQLAIQQLEAKQLVTLQLRQTDTQLSSQLVYQGILLSQNFEQALFLAQSFGFGDIEADLKLAQDFIHSMVLRLKIEHQDLNSDQPFTLDLNAETQLHGVSHTPQNDSLYDSLNSGKKRYWRDFSAQLSLQSLMSFDLNEHQLSFKSSQLKLNIPTFAIHQSIAVAAPLDVAENNATKTVKGIIEDISMKTSEETTTNITEMAVTLNNQSTSFKDIVDPLKPILFDSEIQAKITHTAASSEGVTRRLSGVWQSTQSIDLKHLFSSTGRTVAMPFHYQQPGLSLDLNIFLNWQNLSADLTDTQLNASIGAKKIAIGSRLLSNLETKMEAIATTDTWLISANSFLAEGNAIVWNGWLNRNSGDYDFSINKQSIELSWLNQVLSFISTKDMPIEAFQGNLAAQLNTRGSDILQGQAAVSIADLGLTAGKIRLDGLTLEAQIDRTNPLASESQVSLNKLKFASGLTISKLLAELHSSSANFWTINNIQAMILGGTLFIADVNWQTDQFDPFEAKLNDISLTELVDLVDVADIYADGSVDWVLPLSMSSGAIEIHQGHFKSTSNGVIRYTKGTPSKKDNLAIQAMRNFHYTELDGDINYHTDGTFLIKLHLLGKNPELYNGYPLDLILNINGTLPGAFTSLFLSGDFEGSVSQMIGVKGKSPANIH